MKSTPIREQAHDFTRVCQVITGFVHAHHGLTAVEREIVCNFVRKLETEVGQFAPEPSTDDPSLAAPRSRPPCSTDPLLAHIHEAIYRQTGEYPSSSLFE